jgi:NADH pyrophosphatase NudC (nudix superfamily)
MYTIHWIGTVAIGILEDGKPKFVLGFKLGQDVPAELRVDDEVTLINHPQHPANFAMGMNGEYCEVTHARSGKMIMRRVYEYMFCSMCGKPCHPEDRVTDRQGHTFHKVCYREALIKGKESL